MSTDPPSCLRCRHYDASSPASAPRCAAFPVHIPWDIWNGLTDHRTPVEGDGGIQFEPIAEEGRA